MDDTKRLLLALVLSAALLWGYTTFFAPSPSPKPAPEQKTTATTQATATAKAPAAAQAPGTTQAPPAAVPALPATAAAAAGSAGKARDVTVRTPLYTAVFSEKGGTIKKLTLHKYYAEPNKQGGRYVLLDLEDQPGGSLGLSLTKAAPALDSQVFKADKHQITLAAGDKPASLSFTAREGDVLVQKTYTFSPGRYQFGLAVRVRNLGQKALETAPEISLTETDKKQGHNKYAFTGVQLYTTDNGLTELDPGDLKDKPVKSGDMKWMAMSIPYFMGAVIPLSEPQAKRSMRGSIGKDGMMTGTMVGAPLKIGPGKTMDRSYIVFYGPRDLEVLKPIGHELARAVDFGWFDIIAKPMLAALNFLYSFLGNYGIAIILVTILTKVIFWPLTAKSYKSMAQMQKLQPHIKRLKEKYKDDKQRMNQEMMQLYKTYKVNPMGGCLPMVVQIPVFIAFYKVLGASIELRHAPFMFWINDLSAPDRLLPGLHLPWVGGIPVLTLLMGVSMFFQQKMTPTAMDPTQAKMMMLMPVVFTFVFINFPSGLVLYWLVNNLLSIGQQYYTNKQKAAGKA